jgi:hypothetical protein
MEWTHIACMAAGGLLGSFLMTVWQNERAYRRRERDFTVPVRLADGWWFPKAEGPPPPAPPPPPKCATH